MPSRLISVALFLIFFPLLAEALQVQFNPDRDATLYEEPDGALANGAGSYLFIGQTAQSADLDLRRALVRFDVSVIPDDAVIQSVEVQFQINNVPSTPVGGTATLHRVLASWGEGNSDAPGEEGAGVPALLDDATWRHRFYDATLWSFIGGDFVFTASASTGYGSALEALIFSNSAALRADVQSWVNDADANHGWMVRGQEGSAYTARRLIGKDAVEDPKPLLIVDYVIPSPTDNLTLTQVGSGLGQPVSIANASDGSGRLFVVDRTGFIRIIDLSTGTVLPTPYLDLSAVVDDAGGEQGLLGLAFHPDFESNRQFYVNYTRDLGAGLDRSVVAMYTQSDLNENVANTTPTVLLEFEQDASNHNGGDMHFGIDGYLYIASGDGGGSADNAQDEDTLKGAILRIDVDGSAQPGDELCGLVTNYGVPAGNAFPGDTDGCDEILHFGLRNPWRFSFDAQTEEMYIGDVGQFTWEEVDYAASGTSGLNFGWPCFEGFEVFDAGATCPNPVPPIFAYSSVGGSGNCAVTGGYVYRGSGAALVGRYVYGDYCSDRVWIATDNQGNWESIEWPAAVDVLESITAFGQDEFCELYIADGQAGIVYRIDDTERVSRSSFEALRCQ